MKKVLLIAAVAGLAMVSCKKDYTCECTFSNSAGGASTTQKFTIYDVSKGTAKRACVKITSEDTSGGTTTTDTQDCKLK